MLLLTIFFPHKFQETISQNPPIHVLTFIWVSKISRVIGK